MRKTFDPLVMIPSPEAIRERLAATIVLADRLRFLLDVAERLRAPTELEVDPMKEYLSVGEVAAKFSGVTPKLLTSLFYRKILDTKRCPMVVGRRVIPPAYVPAIAAKLADLGYAKGGK